jgi:hypothetical protein
MAGLVLYLAESVSVAVAVSTMLGRRVLREETVSVPAAVSETEERAVKAAASVSAPVAVSLMAGLAM